MISAERVFVFTVLSIVGTLGCVKGLPWMVVVAGVAMLIETVWGE